MSVIDVTQIVSQFREADFKAVVKSNPLGNLLYRKFFPLLFSTSLNFKSIESTSGAKVMADLVAKGSKAPRKGRELVESIAGEIPKIEIARDLDEHDLFRIKDLENAVRNYPDNAGVRKQLINKIYEDPIFCINGVNARAEYMAKQLASTGKYKATTGDNAKGVVEVELDFGISTTNTTLNFYDDTKLTTLDLIGEIRKMYKQGKGKGHSFKKMITNQSTFEQLMKSEKIMKFAASFAQNALGLLQNPTLPQINSALASHGLPQFEIWESIVAKESKDGVITAISGWEEGNVLFICDDTIGNTQYTLSPEMSLDLKTTMTKSVSDEFILVKTWGQEDPVTVSTKALAFGTPVMNNVNRTAILKTKTA